jgi:NTE family protein
VKQLGLALGGGGLRGLAHIGVLQVLRENGIPVSYISGTSAGSIVAALYAAGVSPYQMEKVVLGLKPADFLDYNIAGLFKYLLSHIIPKYSNHLDGIILGHKLEKRMRALTGGKTLQEAVLPLAIIACDIDTGREVIFTNFNFEAETSDCVVIRDGFISAAVRASISIPATFIPCHMHGMQLVDGGIKEVVPVTVQKGMGAEYILAVNLGKEIYDDKVNGIPRIISRTIDIMIYETSETALDLLADMVLYPQVEPVSLYDLGKAGNIIRAGRLAMKERVSELKKQL